MTPIEKALKKLWDQYTTQESYFSWKGNILTSQISTILWNSSFAKNRSCSLLIIPNFLIWLWNKNEYEISDNPYWYSKQEGEFYSFDRFQNDFTLNSYGNQHIQSSDPAKFVEAKISISEEIEKYERTVYSFLDLTGQIGGIYELLEITAAFFVGYYNSIIFNYELVNKIKASDGEKFNRKISKTQKALSEEDKDNSHRHHTTIYHKTGDTLSLFDNSNRYSIKDLWRSLCTIKWWNKRK